MMLRFTKMHGLGGDFVVLDLITQTLQLTPELIRHLADRQRGVGCDQVLVIEPPSNPDMDFRYRSFLRDGDESSQGGNGARCIARFIRDHRLSAKRRLRVETPSGPLVMTTHKGHMVSVSLGIPRLEPQEIPFKAACRAASYTFDVCNQQLPLSVVSPGIPYAVQLVDDIDSAAVAALGPALETHDDFPQQASTAFLQVASREEIHVRAYLRGVGEVSACDYGAGAAVMAGRLLGLLADQVRVNMPGGFLRVEWRGEGDTLRVSGPALTIFEGQITS